jgi:hypothetical protein
MWVAAGILGLLLVGLGLVPCLPPVRWLEVPAGSHNVSMGAWALVPGDPSSVPQDFDHIVYSTQFGRGHYWGARVNNRIYYVIWSRARP